MAKAFISNQTSCLWIQGGAKPELLRQWFAAPNASVGKQLRAFVRHSRRVRVCLKIASICS